MTHVVLGHCCKDASCVQVCPQNCIHPAPGEPGFDSAETLHIDPRSCIDCTACVEACPASAIKSGFRLTDAEQRFALLGAEYFRTRPVAPPVAAGGRSFGRALSASRSGPRVAVVGAGPAALYTVRELLRRSSSVRVTVFERDDQVGGLLRRGVSRADGPVRAMIRLFDKPFGDDRVRVLLGTELGTDVTLESLRADFDAVVLACGTSRPRPIVAGGPARLPGCHQAIDVLSDAGRAAAGPGCLVVGAGNVAIDVVRQLAIANRGLSATDRVRQVVVLARGDRAAFTLSAFAAIAASDELEPAIDREGAAPGAADPRVAAELRRLPPIGSGDPAFDVPDRIRVLFSFGAGEVTSVEPDAGGRLAARTGTGRIFRADSVIGAAGFEFEPIDGVPVGAGGTVAHARGRVVDPGTGAALDGLYVTGWAKRGPVGGVGDNRPCAAETVAHLATDLARASAADPLFER